MAAPAAASANRLRNLSQVAKFVLTERASAASRASLQDPHRASVSQLLGGRVSSYATIRASLRVTDAVREMNDRNVGALIVLEDTRQSTGRTRDLEPAEPSSPPNTSVSPMPELKGIVTERDVLAAVPRLLASPNSLTVADIMSHDPRTVNADATIGDCMDLMMQHGFRHLPVLENGDLVGVLSIRDIVQKLNKDQKDLVVDLNVQLARLSALSSGADAASTSGETKKSGWWG